MTDHNLFLKLLNINGQQKSSILIYHSNFETRSHIQYLKYEI